jgi:hypothetical protein
MLFNDVLYNSVDYRCDDDPRSFVDEEPERPTRLEEARPTEEAVFLRPEEAP